VNSTRPPRRRTVALGLALGLALAAAGCGHAAGAAKPESPSPASTVGPPTTGAATSDPDLGRVTTELDTLDRDLAAIDHDTQQADTASTQENRP
jgi:hypothetical protein